MNNQFNEWLNTKIKAFDTTDKETLKRTIIYNMLDKTLSMFKYTGLPDTIPQKDLEIILQINSHATFTRVDGKLYAFASNLGGIPNPYYLPTLSIVANPSLKFNKELEIDKDCVVVLNDHLYQGLTPMFDKYANLLVESEISLKYAIMNARIPSIIQADNETSRESAELFFKKLYEGKEYGIITSNAFFDGIKSMDFYPAPQITQLIESIQYIKGSWYNELGLNSTFNMKREVLNEAEALQNNDILRPTIDMMLECRKIGMEKVNEMFGTNISVEFNEVWKDKDKSNELDLELKENVVENEGTKNEIKRNNKFTESVE